MFSQSTSILPSMIIKSTYSEFKGQPTVIIESTSCFGFNSLQFLLTDFRLIFYGRVVWFAVYVFIPIDKQSQTDHHIKSVTDSFLRTENGAAGCVADYFEAFETFKTVFNQRAEQLNEKLVIRHSFHAVEERNKALKGSFKFKPQLVYTSVTFRCVHVQLKSEQKKKRKIIVNV